MARLLFGKLFKMSKTISPEVKAQLVALLPVYPSNLKIVGRLKSLENRFNLSTVERARREEKLKAKGWIKPPTKLLRTYVTES